MLFFGVAILGFMKILSESRRKGIVFLGLAFLHPQHPQPPKPCHLCIKFGFFLTPLKYGHQFLFALLSSARVGYLG